ncbi:hypothetical protein [Flavobacterium sp.]|uniref:hypothetical protein n=1 Tax=Flavobacterium sp. TaxID=239 RepID=UPI0025C342A1|nr:hypothetical protein [Flavobacterium sp.]
MKKITLLVFAFLVLSCSSDDDSAPTNPCEVTVFGYSSSPGENGTWIYYVTYGTSEQDQTTANVNAATYNFYSSQQGQNFVCWEGTK